MKNSVFPDRPVKIIMPNLVGFAPDIVVRIIAEFLSDLWQQPVQIENLPGVAQVTGTKKVIEAAPDGYTLLGNSTSHVSIPLVYTDLPYHLEKDLTEIAMLGESPFVMMTSAGNAWATLQEFVEIAKDKPGHFSFPTLGIGYATHFAAEYFNQAAHLSLTCLLAANEQDAFSALLSGRAAFFMVPENIALKKLADKRFKALAVTSKSRSVHLPLVPTIAETGYPHFEKMIWFGIWAPAGVPAAIRQTINAAIQAALRDPKTRSALSNAGVNPRPMSVESFTELVNKEILNHQEIAVAAKMPVCRVI